MADSELSTVKQCSETRDYLYRKIMVRTSFIGEDSAISTLASTQKKGTAFSGILSDAVEHSVIESSVTEKMEADRTKWNVTYSIYTEHSGGGGGETSAVYYTSQDSMTMVQYQFPLYKYLSADEAAAVQSWESYDWDGEKAEDEGVKKSDFKYWNPLSSNFQPLTTVSQKAASVARKLFAGVEYVQKAYPQITHVERSATRQTHTTRQNALNHIDNTGVPDLGMKNDFSWLKVQYDWTENDDSTWTLTESWTGIPKDNPWDADLYGPNAWAFYNPPPSTSPSPDPDPEP